MNKMTSKLSLVVHGHRLEALGGFNVLVGNFEESAVGFII
jgi:hypothetical protein